MHVWVCVGLHGARNKRHRQMRIRFKPHANSQMIGNACESVKVVLQIICAN